MPHILTQFFAYSALLVGCPMLIAMDTSGEQHCSVNAPMIREAPGILRSTNTASSQMLSLLRDGDFLPVTAPCAYVAYMYVLCDNEDCCSTVHVHRAEGCSVLVRLHMNLFPHRRVTIRVFLM